MSTQRPNVTKAVWAGKFALAPLGLYLCVLASSVWWATQYVAARLAYQPELGEPLLRLFGFPVYRPWQVLPWNYYFHYYAPRIFIAGMLQIAVGSLIALVAAIVYAVWAARRARVATSHGTARFQTTTEIESGQLCRNEGVLFGLSPGGQYLRYGGDGHVYSVAPSRAGKGVGQVIPTLLTYSGSVIVNDVKGENWEKTAGYRSRFSHVLYWDPTDPHSCHYNPLLEIRRGIHEIKDVGNLVSILIDPLGTGKATFWEREATNLLIAVILHVLHSEPTKTLAGVAYFLANPQRRVEDSLQIMIRTDYGEPDITRFIRSSAQQAAQKFEKELSGVVSTANSVLNVFRDPLLERLMADSDFRIEDIRTLENPVSLYLKVPPTDARRLAPALRLMWEQLVRRQIENLEVSKAPHKLLLMLDEFPRLGRLEVLGEAIDLVAGYGLQMYMLCQGANHVVDIWGPNHRFVTNSAVRIYATPNDNITAREISEQLGPATNVHQTRTFTGHRLSPWLGHVMISDQETQRPLMTAGEVLTMDRRDLLVLTHAEHPIRARQLRYFEDKELKRRVLPPPPLLDANGRRRLRLTPKANGWANATTGTFPSPAAADTTTPGSVAAAQSPRPEPMASERGRPSLDLEAVKALGRAASDQWRKQLHERAQKIQQSSEAQEPTEHDNAGLDLPDHVLERLDDVAQQTLKQETALENAAVSSERAVDPAKLVLAEQEAFLARRHRTHERPSLER